MAADSDKGRATHRRRIGRYFLARPITAVVLCLATEAPQAFQAAATFQLVSIRRATAAVPPVSTGNVRPPITVLPDGRIEARGVTVVDLARVAYGFESVDPSEDVVSSSAGNWTLRDRFDVTAVLGRPWAQSGDRLPPELRPMLQTLLEQRFALKASIGKKSIPGYGLRLAKPGKLGPMLRPSSSQCPDPANGPIGEAGCTRIVRTDRIELISVTPTEFLQLVWRGRMAGPVVDQTALEGRYDIVLTTGLPADRPGSTNLLPQQRSIIPLLDAMKHQLGLELRAVKLSAPTLSIQQARRPVED